MNEILHIAVGQKGTHNGSGSGGTFIVKQLSNSCFEKVIIAGGAGGDYTQKCSTYSDASLDEFGNGESRNMNIGCSGEVFINSQPGAGYQKNAPGATEESPKCFVDGLQGGFNE